MVAAQNYTHCSGRGSSNVSEKILTEQDTELAPETNVTVNSTLCTDNQAPVTKVFTDTNSAVADNLAPATDISVDQTPTWTESARKNPVTPSTSYYSQEKSIDQYIEQITPSVVQPQMPSETNDLQKPPIVSLSPPLSYTTINSDISIGAYICNPTCNNNTMNGEITIQIPPNFIVSYSNGFTEGGGGIYVGQFSLESGKGTTLYLIASSNKAENYLINFAVDYWPNDNKNFDHQINLNRIVTVQSSSDQMITNVVILGGLFGGIIGGILYFRNHYKINLTKK